MERNDWIWFGLLLFCLLLVLAQGALVIGKLLGWVTIGWKTVLMPVIILGVIGAIAAALFLVFGCFLVALGAAYKSDANRK